MNSQSPRLKKGSAFHPNLSQGVLLQDAVHSAGIILQNSTKLNKQQIFSEKAKYIILKTDNFGIILNGTKHYVLHIPNAAAKSWSVTLYDAQTASMLQNTLQLHPYILSTNKDLHYNNDKVSTSILHLRWRNETLKANTVKTVARKSFFTIVRFYNSKILFR